MKRKEFIKDALALAVIGAVCPAAKSAGSESAARERKLPKVYFTRTITPQKLVEMYNVLGFTELAEGVKHGFFRLVMEAEIPNRDATSAQ